jgi:hypothetical protein
LFFRGVSGEAVTLVVRIPTAWEREFCVTVSVCVLGPTRVDGFLKIVSFSSGARLLVSDGVAADGGGVAREICPSFAILVLRCERTPHFFISISAVSVNSDLRY